MLKQGGKSLNRTIKFRAWNNKEKKWENGDFWKQRLRVHYQSSSPSTLEMYHDSYEDYILTQYIGFKDRYGREIFEGDIIRSNRFYDSVVKFKNGSFLLDDISFDDAKTTYPDVIYEVISNIFENNQVE